MTNVEIAKCTMEEERKMTGKTWNAVSWLAKDRTGWRRLIDALCSSQSEEKRNMWARVAVIEVLGKRRRGRPKRRWLDNIRNDLSERELSEEEAQDWVQRRRLIRIIDPA